MSNQDKIVQPALNNKADIPETNKNIPNIPQKPIKLSKLDQGILTVMHANPEANRTEIVNKTYDLGLVKHKQTVYNRLKKRDYLQAELSQIEDYHAQQLQREDYPLARKRLNKALSDKDETGAYVLSHKEAFPMIKLVYDKVHGEKHFNQAPQVVHIDAINNAQFNISNDVA